MNAISFYRMAFEGKPRKAVERYVGDEYIQHNPSVRDGKEGFINYFEQMHLLLCIMNGGLILAGKLATLLDFPLQIDYLHATRYRGETRGAELNWLAYPRERIKGRDILLVDDILDEGNTLAAVKAYCIEQGAKSVYTAVLADKKHARRLPGISADCAGLQLEDKFVFGSGLDYKGYLRNVAGIYAIDESALSEQP